MENKSFDIKKLFEDRTLEAIAQVEMFIFIVLMLLLLIKDLYFGG